MDSLWKIVISTKKLPSRLRGFVVKNRVDAAVHQHAAEDHAWENPLKVPESTGCPSTTDSHLPRRHEGTKDRHG
jgi:hypothetical protein